MSARLANLCCGHAACQREVKALLATAWAAGWKARDPHNAEPMAGDNPHEDEEANA